MIVFILKDFIILGTFKFKTVTSIKRKRKSYGQFMSLNPNQIKIMRQAMMMLRIFTIGMF